jgi:hypothetical protein
MPLEISASSLVLQVHPFASCAFLSLSSRSHCLVLNRCDAGGSGASFARAPQAVVHDLPGSALDWTGGYGQSAMLALRSTMR